MNPAVTILLLVSAGIALVIQNLIMVRITATVSTVLITLAINSIGGLAFLLVMLLWRNGFAAIAETLGAIRPWSVLPGLLGTFFVFSGIYGYQRIGAASTIALLVASQLIAGLAIDLGRSSPPNSGANGLAIFGAVLLVLGAFLVARRTL